MACLRKEFLDGAPPCECCQGHDRDWEAYLAIVQPLEEREDAVALREEAVAARENRNWNLTIYGWMIAFGGAGLVLLGVFLNLLALGLWK